MPKVDNADPHSSIFVNFYRFFFPLHRQLQSTFVNFWRCFEFFRGYYARRAPPHQFPGPQRHPLTLLSSPWVPRHRATVGSYGGGVTYERGAPVIAPSAPIAPGAKKRPVSSERGTCNTFMARFWPWLCAKNPRLGHSVRRAPPHRFPGPLSTFVDILSTFVNVCQFLSLFCQLLSLNHQLLSTSVNFGAVLDVS